MQIEEKQRIIRELAKQQAFGVKKAFNFGHSYGVIIPMTWIKFHCTSIDGEYYFKFGIEDGRLIISPITDNDLEGVVLKKKDSL
jgi:hypothetical protein